jgi:hypothetical protein
MNYILMFKNCTNSTYQTLNQFLTITMWHLAIVTYYYLSMECWYFQKFSASTINLFGWLIAKMLDIDSHLMYDASLQKYLRSTDPGSDVVAPKIWNWINKYEYDGNGNKNPTHTAYWLLILILYGYVNLCIYLHLQMWSPYIWIKIKVQETS